MGQMGSARQGGILVAVLKSIWTFSILFGYLQSKKGLYIFLANFFFDKLFGKPLFFLGWKIFCQVGLGPKLPRPSAEYLLEALSQWASQGNLQAEASLASSFLVAQNSTGVNISQKHEPWSLDNLWSAKKWRQHPKHFWGQDVDHKLGSIFFRLRLSSLGAFGDDVITSRPGWGDLTGAKKGKAFL